MSAKALPGGSARRERLRRERTAAQLRRHAALEAEVREQLEPLLGPAGRPVGDAATALWRRRRVEAYLALGPLVRARRTWTAWGHLRRGLAVLALAPLWTVALLPLRILGLAGLTASHAGVVAVAAAAPVAAFVPPRVRGRFAGPLPEPGPPWRGSRASRVAARALGAAALVAVAALAVAAVLGPGPAAAPAGHITPAARHADVVVVRDLVRRACGPATAVAVSPLGPHRYLARVAGGAATTVQIAPGTGFASTGARARPQGAVGCPPG